MAKPRFESPYLPFVVLKFRSRENSKQCCHFNWCKDRGITSQGPQIHSRLRKMCCLSLPHKREKSRGCLQSCWNEKCRSFPKEWRPSNSYLKPVFGALQRRGVGKWPMAASRSIILYIAAEFQQTVNHFELRHLFRDFVIYSATNSSGLRYSLEFTRRQKVRHQAQLLLRVYLTHNHMPFS